MKLAFLSARRSGHTVRWVNGMAERGHEVHLLTMHRGGAPVDERVQVHVLPVRPPLGYLANVPRARRLLRQIQPDILHAHYATGYGTLARLTGFHPEVLSVWGMDVYDFPDTSPVHRRLLLANLQHADWICSTSHAMAARTRSLWPTERPISVTPFGIDVDRFCPTAGVRDPRVITIGTVKGLYPKYGVDLLIRAFAKVRQRPSASVSDAASKLKLRIVGDGSERSKLAALVVDLGLEGVTSFTGRVPHHEVPAQLNSMDIYVAASRSDSESFGVAVLEASACGLPVVVSDVGGLPEVVRHEQTGLVVPRENVSALADALRRLIEDAGLRQQLGQTGREHVASHYSWPDSLLLMEEVYVRALAGRGQKGPRERGPVCTSSF
jgi:glycosyltransferase involved in cell wall biosynthesis